MLAAALLAAVLAGCGQSMSTPLPDLTNKTASPNGQQPMSTAEQKKAIDALIAKRDAKDPAAAK